MKLDDDYLVREIVGESVLVPVGRKVIEFKGIMNLSPGGAFICRMLDKPCTFEQILGAFLDEYDVPENIAKADIEEFLGKLREFGVLQDE